MPKPTISPVQALLILLKENKQDPILRRWLLSGIEKQDHATFFERVKASGMLELYDLSTSDIVINEDPAKRYFETHLSFHTINNMIDEFSREDLEKHVSDLRGILPERKPANASMLDQLERAIQGRFEPSDEYQFKECATFVARLQNKEMFPDLSEESRKKLILLAQASLIGVVTARTTQVLPLDLYSRGMYDGDKRGIVPKDKKEQASTEDRSYGLMKGHMPNSQDDIALGQSTPAMPKATGLASYNDKADWVKQNFDLLVHPHSNSISGTILTQVRNLGRMVRMGNESQLTQSHEEMNEYFKLYIATLLFANGGHTLLEFAEPLQIKEIREFFPKSLAEPITMETMFMHGNEEAFNEALEESIRYNDSLLLRANLHKEFLASPQLRAHLEKDEALVLEHSIRTSSADILSTVGELSSQQQRDELIDSKKETQQNSKADIKKTKDKSTRHLGLERWLDTRRNLNENQLIQARLNKANDEITRGDFSAARETISRLKSDLVEQFGKKLAYIKTTEAYRLIKDIETKINAHFDAHDSRVLQSAQENQLIQKYLIRAGREIERSDFTAARDTVAELRTILLGKGTEESEHLKGNKSYGLLQDLEHKIDTHFSELAQKDNSAPTLSYSIKV